MWYRQRLEKHLHNRASSRCSWSSAMWMNLSQPAGRWEATWRAEAHWLLPHQPPEDGRRHPTASSLQLTCLHEETHQRSAQMDWTRRFVCADLLKTLSFGVVCFTGIDTDTYPYNEIWWSNLKEWGEYMPINILRQINKKKSEKLVILQAILEPPPPKFPFSY